MERIPKPLFSDQRQFTGAPYTGSGQVVGHSKLAALGMVDSFLWDSGVMAGLGISEGTATGVNDAGMVVGYYGNYRAFLWNDGTVTDLGSLGTAYRLALAYDINDAGLVVGTSTTDEVVPGLGPMYHAFIWENGVMTDLGVLPGDTESGAIAINSFGQVVGVSDLVDPETYQRTARSFL